MRIFLVLVIPVLAFGFYSVETKSTDSGQVALNFKIETKDLKFQKTAWGREVFTTLVHNESKRDAGEPDIPVIYQWVAVEEGVEYDIEVSVSEPQRLEGILLSPVQPDHLEKEPSQFTIRRSAYATDSWAGGETVTAEETMQLGPVKIISVAVSPVQYSAASRQLRIFEKVSVRFAPKTPVKHRNKDKISQFVAEQVKGLVSNADEVLKNHPVDTEKKIVIAASNALMPYAKQLGEFRSQEGAQVTYVEIPQAVTPANLQTLIKAQHATVQMDAVLLFGDEKHIPLFKSPDGILGDVYYSFVSGSDQVSDVAMGRLPVSDAVEAGIMIQKIKKHRQMQAAGQVSKNVMLLAHSEEYPGKYTANQEQIRKAANPKGFVYETQYGGNKATNRGVIESVTAKPFAIVDYRGHGSDVAWWEWDAASKDFGFDEVDSLPDDSARLAFYFNVACDNGAIQNSAETLVEKQLFPKREPTFRGAVGTFGATEPSYTETNHRFNAHLFSFLQQSADVSMGNIYTLANNKLTQQNGGTAPANVRMYILFSDPLLKPLVE